MMDVHGHVWLCMNVNECIEVQNNPKHTDKHGKHTRIYPLLKLCKLAQI